MPNLPSIVQAIDDDAENATEVATALVHAFAVLLNTDSIEEIMTYANDVVWHPQNYKGALRSWFRLRPRQREQAERPGVFAAFNETWREFFG